MVFSLGYVDSVVTEIVGSWVPTACVQILALWLTIFVTSGLLLSILCLSVLICEMDAVVPAHGVTVRIEAICTNCFKWCSLNAVVITKWHFLLGLVVFSRVLVYCPRAPVSFAHQEKNLNSCEFAKFLLVRPGQSRCFPKLKDPSSPDELGTCIVRLL